MYKKTKRIISSVLLLCFLMLNVVPICAQTSDFPCSSERISNLNLLKVSDNHLIYTFEKGNIEYKYIEYLIDRDTVVTEKYIKRDNKFVLHETITTNNIGAMLNEEQNNDFFGYHFNEDEQLLTDLESVQSREYQFYWEFHSRSQGSTRWRNMTIAVIASTLAHVTGGDIGHVISVASFLFYELVDTVYYDLTLFKDRNAPSFRPNWKKDIYWYTDPNRTIPTVPPYTIEIIQTWWG